jgi:hypothetical protein
MPTSPTTAVLDTILAWQLTVAWAGESRETTKRLGWWNTDLVDATGGGDLMARLLPRTHAWASLEAVREAARRVDEQARKRSADPDAVRTLFFFGYELDERLAERLVELKRAGVSPADALPLPIPLSDFKTETFSAALKGEGKGPSFEVTPGGRHAKGSMPVQPDQLVRHLAAALLPLSDAYPAPFYRVKG